MAAPMAGSSGPIQPCEQLQRIRVAIVGGGFAGLAAGFRLRQFNVATTVFEANQKVGGRVFTDDRLVPGKVVEIGAELIGRNHAMWVWLASQFGLRLDEVTDYEAGGDDPSVIPPSLFVRRIFAEHEITGDEWVVIESDIEQIQRVIGMQAYSVNPEAPWLTDNAEQLDNTSVATALAGLWQMYPPKHPLSPAVLDFTIANDNCAITARQSYLGLLAMVSGGRCPTGDPTDPDGMLGYWTETETHRCAGGNQQLAYAMQNVIGDVRVNSPVGTIDVDRSGVTIWLQNNLNERFDYVVLSPPPTAWPAVRSEWEWQPRVFSHANACKFFAVYDNAFWLNLSLAPAAYWDRLGQVWNGTDNQYNPANPYEVLAVFAGEPYVVEDQYHYKNGLDWLYGTQWPPRLWRLIVWRMWPYIWAGYAYPGVGEVTKAGPFLTTPYANRLFFAGEQTYVGFMGYMEGALRSGFRAADQIIGVACGQPEPVPEPTAVSWDRTQGSA